MPIMTERIIYLTKLVKPYCRNGTLMKDATQNIIDAFKELKDWADMQGQ